MMTMAFTFGVGNGECRSWTLGRPVAISVVIYATERSDSVSNRQVNFTLKSLDVIIGFQTGHDDVKHP